jgi:hypothetical protein
VEGKETNQLAIRVHVFRKLPRRELDRRFVPEMLEGIPVDVIEAPMAELGASGPACANPRGRIRPVMGGISAGWSGGTAGTIACFCRSTRRGDNPEDIFALSAGHVFADPKGLGLQEILQPGKIDGGTAVDRVAYLERHTAIRGVGNTVDGAIAKLIDRTNFIADVAHIGAPVGSAPATPGMEVVKHGRTTGYGEGKVTDTELDTKIRVRPGVSALFEDQIRIETPLPGGMFAKDGDSGALVMEKLTQAAVGLIFATTRSGSYGVASPLSFVLRELEIELIGIGP